MKRKTLAKVELAISFVGFCCMFVAFYYAGMESDETIKGSYIGSGLVTFAGSLGTLLYGISDFKNSKEGK